MSDWRDESEEVKDAAAPDWMHESSEVVQPAPNPSPDPAWLSALRNLGTSAGAALHGGAKGASLGFLDEAQGLLGASAAVGARVGAKLGLSQNDELQATLDTLPAPLRAPMQAAVEQGLLDQYGLGSVSGAYAGMRDQARDTERRIRASNPTAYGAGELVGSIAAPIPGPAAARPLQTVGSRLMQLGKYGAKLGAVTGFGNSEATNAADLARDTAGGAVVGGVATGALGTGADLLTARALKPWLARVAEEKAVNAITPSAGLSNKLRKLGIASEDEIRQFGRDILDAGVLRPFGRAANALKRTEALNSEAGEKIGAELGALDEKVAAGEALPFNEAWNRKATMRAIDKAADTPASEELAAGVKQKLLDYLPKPPPKPAAVSGVNPGSSDYVAAALGRETTAPAPAVAPRTFSTMWKNKSQLQESLKPDEFAKLQQRLYNRGVSGNTRNIYQQFETQAGPDALDRLREAAKTFGTTAKIEDFLRELASRQAQNNTIGLSDLNIGKIAAEGGGAALGTAATLGSALMRGRMSSTLATGADALSRARLPSALAPYLAPPALMRATEPADQRKEDAITSFLTDG